MPLEIKGKRDKEVKTIGVIGNSLKCGHCDFPIMDQHTWIAFDEPYNCLVHETCMGLFDYNSKPRTAGSNGRKSAHMAMDNDLKILEEMTSRPWFQKTSAMTPARKKALQNLMLIYQSLRTMGVVKTEYAFADPKNEDDVKEVALPDTVEPKPFYYKPSSTQ
jgi:hypothetical protein